MALISVGMPVLNAEKVISRAIQDIQNQTFDDFELVICDNASDDRTVEIASQFAKDDARIKLVKFTERVDIMHSFKRALDTTSAPFFMFAPADDRWYRTFMAETLAVLQGDKSLAACTGRVAFFEDNLLSRISTGTAPLLQSPGENVVTFLRDPVENARIFSLIRREAMRDVFPATCYPGWDFQMTARALMHGGFHEIPVVLAERDVTPMQAYVTQAVNWFSNPMLRAFPLHRLAIEILRDRQIPHARGLRRALWHVNARSHRNYAAHQLPRWHGLISKFDGMFAISGDPNGSSRFGLSREVMDRSAVLERE